MIGVKNLFDGVEPKDGLRIWIEPVRLTSDLAEWCGVDVVLSDLAPPQALWEWFDDHPYAYATFRRRYHEYLAHDSLTPILQQLAQMGADMDLTFLHQSNNHARNTATAFVAFLTAFMLAHYRQFQGGSTRPDFS